MAAGADVAMGGGDDMAIVDALAVIPLRSRSAQYVSS